METALAIIALVVAVLAGTALADWLRVPPPLLLVVLGIAASYLPMLPPVQLSPEVVLYGFLPPLLYTASLQTSLFDFKAQRRPILLLSVGLVLATTGTVGVVVHALLPGVSWAAAFAIGAVVAPPDAVAATAIGRRIGLPRDVVAILEGESLLNDATALVALRTALAALAGGIAAWEVGLDFLRAAGGGVLIGLVAFVVVARIRRHVTDPLLSTAISMVTPFATYVGAENHVVHASGVIAVVTAGLLLGHKTQILDTPLSRITESVTWRTVAFLLENTVFLLIGLQARWIVDGVIASGVGLGTVVAVCAATLAVVIATRLAWLYGSRVFLWAGRRRAPRPLSHATLIGWAGMRGVVTLAAAFIIPPETPYRDVFLLIAFTVVAGTLLIQGLTLPALTRALRVRPPDPAEDALARATLLQQAAQAGTDRLDALTGDDRHGVRALIRARVDQRTLAAWERLSTTPGVEAPSAEYARLRKAMIGAERERVLQIRSLGQVPSDVVREVLGLLDIEESTIDAGSAEREAIRTEPTRGSDAECAELEAFPAIQTVPQPVCAECLVDGTTPVALRQCLVCGNIGCCDSSPGQHATAHFAATGHPVMESAEPGEEWRWCYVHHLTA